MTVLPATSAKRPCGCELDPWVFGHLCRVLTWRERYRIARRLLDDGRIRFHAIGEIYTRRPT